MAQNLYLNILQDIDKIFLYFSSPLTCSSFQVTKRKRKEKSKHLKLNLVRDSHNMQEIYIKSTLKGSVVVVLQKVTTF